MKNIKKYTLILSVFILPSCSKDYIKESNTKKINNSNYSSISGCFQFFLEENEFINLISTKEETTLNNKLYELKKISAESIYEKFDATNNVLNYINELETINDNIKNNSYFKKTKKSLINDLNILKNEIHFESHFIANNFHESFKKINIHKDLSPLLDTLNHSDNSIEIYNKKTKKRSKYLINDKEDFNNIKKFHQLIESHTNTFNKKLNDTNQLNLMHPTFSLSHAYLIKTIIEYFNSKENDPNSNEIKSTLNEIVRAHVYINLVQLSSDFIDSGIKIIHIIKILNNNEMQTIQPFQFFTKISSKVNVGLNFLNIIFDGLELAYAKNTSDILKYKTQLGIDTATLIASGAGMYLGETTAGIFLSGLGVIFGGLSVGFSGFVESTAPVTEQTLSFAKYFLDYEKNHKLLMKGSNFYPDTDERMITLAHKNLDKINDEIKSEHLDVVIEELDFTQKDKYKIVFSDHIAYPYKEYPTSTNIEFDYESREFVKIRESLGDDFKNNKTIEFPLEKIDKIILPNQAQYLITYKHMFVPFITSRYDAELSSVRKIAQNSKFIFDYFSYFSGEQSIGELNFKAQDTTINIKLNSESRELFFLTHEIPDFSKGKILYKFNTENDLSSDTNTYHVLLAEGANYEMNLLKSDEWHFHMNDKMNHISYDEKKKILSIKYFNEIQKEHSIIFSETMPKKIYLHDSTGITNEIFSNNKINIRPAHLGTYLNAKNINNNDDLFSNISKYFNNFEYSLNFTEKYFKITNFKKTDTSQPETIFYDIFNQTYIYSGINNENIEIIGKINGTYVYKEKNKNKIVFKTSENLLEIDYDEYFLDDKFYIKKKLYNSYILYELNSNGLYLVETKYNDTIQKDIYQFFNNNNYNNNYNDLKYIFWTYGFSISDKVNNTIKYASDKSYIKSNIADIVRLTIDSEGKKTKLFYIHSKNEIIDLKDESAKIIYTYNDKILKYKYYFISGISKSKIIKLHENGNIEVKDLNYSIGKVILENNGFILETKFGRLYKIDRENKSSLVGLSPKWLENNLNKNLMTALENLHTTSEIIKLFINEDESAEYHYKDKKIILTRNNKVPLGESKQHHDRYYFYDTELDKNFYINDMNHFKADNYQIIKNKNGLIALKYEGSAINWHESKNDENIIIHRIDTNKKLGLFINSFFK